MAFRRSAVRSRLAPPTVSEAYGARIDRRNRCAPIGAVVGFPKSLDCRGRITPLAFCSCYGRRQCIRPRTTDHGPRQSAAWADRLLPRGRLPGALMQRRADLCCGRVRQLPGTGQRRGSGVASQCSGGRGGRVGAARRVTGAILNSRVRPRRVQLWGPEPRGQQRSQRG
jgi:hypothetical protein